MGDSIVDEIYYRILRDEQGGGLKTLLQQRGQIQQISKAVEYIHLSPLQYAKSIKLFQAQTLIREGRSVSEASYSVGYNSPAQFSREYKRHFGFSPSAQ